MIPEDGEGKVVHFEDVNGVLTAHLNIGGEAAIAADTYPRLRKSEIECILRGWTPFYRERITLPNSETVL